MILTDIPSDKNVIIISHPRSGSTWLQSCLPHVNCHEPFSPDIDYFVDETGPNWSLRSRLDNRIVWLSETKKRIEIVNSVLVPKSVNIQTYQLVNKHVIKWILAQNATIIWLSRLNRLAAFRSLCVSYELNKFIGDYESNTSIKIPLNDSVMHYNAIYNNHAYKVKDKLSHLLNIHLRYEDLLSDSALLSPIKKQNTIDVYISNWEEIMCYLTTNNLLTE